MARFPARAFHRRGGGDAGRGLLIKKLSVLPAHGAAGGDLARKAIGASEQIRAVTGVGLSGVAKRLGG